MGDISDKFFLVIIAFSQLMGHIVQRVRQLSHFILLVDLKVIFEIPLGILPGGLGNFHQRPVYGKGKDSQHQKGQKKDQKNR